MLTALSIRDIVLIEKLDLEIGGGLTVLTGETGAGKSIIVGALSLILGERASADVVRTGADRAIVTEVAGTTRDLLTERVDVLTRTRRGGRARCSGSSCTVRGSWAVVSVKGTLSPPPMRTTWAT